MARVFFAQQEHIFKGKILVEINQAEQALLFDLVQPLTLPDKPKLFLEPFVSPAYTTRLKSNRGAHVVKPLVSSGRHKSSILSSKS